MSEDKTTPLLIEALQQALSEPAEQRLYRSGKLAGLFAARHGLPGDAAAQALRDGLLEVVRTETRGKAVIDWVRPTPRSVDFLHEHQSPLHALRELRAAVESNKRAIPPWLVELGEQLQELKTRVEDQAQRALRRLERLSEAVEQALKRLEKLPSPALNGVSQHVPWAEQLFSYLERRREGGAGSECPLPELFLALATHHPQLSVTEFHAGLRVLEHRGTIRLTPFDGSPENIPQPEYALLDGKSMLYFAAR